MSSVFIKVSVKDRLPDNEEKHLFWHLTDYGYAKFDFYKKKFYQSITQDGGGVYEVEINPSYWFEEIDLPSEEDIIKVAPKKRCVNQFWNGANYVLNKLKGGHNEKD